jgi:hypothetical protein
VRSTNISGSSRHTCKRRPDAGPALGVNGDAGLDGAFFATLRGLLTAGETLAQSSSDLNIGSEVNRIWTFTNLRKDQAQAMYRICQQQDQVWREKRRIRELEELRAKSGGMQFTGAQSGYAGADGGAPDRVGAESEPARRLRQAREMLDAKLISDSEFESIKAKIVAGL